MSEKKNIYFRLGLMAVLLASLFWGFRELVFHQLPFVFQDSHEDMSFGWYVPLFSLYVVWTERKLIAESFGRPSILGLLLTLPFLCLGFIGVRGIQVRFGVLAFAGLCLTIPWALFGRETAKRVLFPCLFLLFCVPLATFLDVVTVHLRLLASSTAYGVLMGLGADVVRKGTMIISRAGAFAIDIAEPCSGLRSIFALMALTAGYAYFNQPTWLRRGILFVLAIPLAILGNVMRILSIALVGTFASKTFAMGFYHDYSGYVVFFVAIALMVASGEVINKVAKRLTKAKMAETTGVCDVPRPAKTASFATPVLLTVLVVAMMFIQSANPAPKLCEAPKVGLPAIDGYSTQRMGASEAETNMLPRDTRIEKCIYLNDDGDWFRVSLVVGGRHKGSIHRPELCLPSQGFLMTNPRTAKVGEKTWRLITLAGNGSRPSLGFAYRFFNQEGYETASHVARIFRDVLDRSLYNRIDRWVMVTVNASTTDEEEIKDFLEKLELNAK